MSVISYNFCGGKYNNGTFCRLMKKIKPSVICLQEANTKIVSDIRNKIGNYTMIQSPGKQGFSSNFTMIDNQYVIKGIDGIDISDVEREALKISVKIDNTHLDIINVHLKSGRDCTSVREKQIKEILKVGDKSGKCLIIGDWNLSKDEVKWPPKNNWKSPLLYPTFRSDNKRIINNNRKFNHAFDRLLYSGVKISDVCVYDGSDNSDHDILCVSINREKYPIQVKDSKIKQIEPYDIVSSGNKEKKSKTKTENANKKTTNNTNKNVTKKTTKRVTNNVTKKKDENKEKKKQVKTTATTKSKPKPKNKESKCKTQ